MINLNDEATAYLHGLHPLYDGMLGKVQKECLDNSVPAIAPETARFLGALLSSLRPGKILEIGCGTGFSAGLMSRYLKEGGHITTIDRYETMISQAKSNFKRMGISEQITLLEGHATDIVPTLTDTYDFIFLDAAKGQYLNLLPYCIKRLRIGGIFVADDIMQEGRTAADRFSVPRRQRTIHTRMRGFLHALTHTEGLESAVLPIGDGLVFCCKNAEIDFKGIITDEES